MILPIHVYGSDVLREKAVEIDINNAEGPSYYPIKVSLITKYL